MKPGDRVGRYVLEAPLGEGGGGVVWRARQSDLDRLVALKRLRRELTGPRERARFEREARVAGALDHPSAVAIYELGEHEGELFLAMELVEGISLRAKCDEGATLREAIDIAAQIADVLASAHFDSGGGTPLVHRDLKPENVVLDEGRARILDFGLAFRTDSERDARMTREGVVAGTPAYLSPEQARGAKVGPPTDVYALGCILYELVSGRVPFEGSDLEVLTRQLYAPAPPLRRDEPVPAPLDALVASMLDKRPHARPRAEQVRDVLLDLDEHARARARKPPTGRAARMVPAAPTSTDATRGEIAVVGTLSAELLLALGAQGLDAFVVTDDEPLEAVEVVFAPGASSEQVRSLGRHARVVTDAEPSDVARLGAMIRAGAVEVVPTPIDASDLVRRLRRALRRRSA